jgi:hypothetical protein
MYLLLKPYAHRPYMRKKKEKRKIFFTNIPHHRSIGKVSLLYFKPIQKKNYFITEILKLVDTKLRTMVGYSL